MISVIIPVYRVEEYLDECVESVINQTYTNLEIILVDDGSPDRCPQMCDEWAKRDRRIRVIHKPNGGLSDARNVGLDNAKGRFVAFLDSDDYMENTCLQKLYDALQNFPDCSIASCSHWLDIDGKIAQTFNNSWIYDEIRFVDPMEYAHRMLLMESVHTAWGKLYKREVFKNIRYRKGRNNEDILFALDFYPIVEKKGYRIVEIPDKLLYYRQREGSICHDKEFSVTEAQNRAEVLEAVKGKKPLVYEAYKRKYIQDLALLLSYKLNYPEKYKFSYITMCKELWKFSNGYARKELNDSEYATYLHCKYFAPLMWLKYAIKRNGNIR